MTKPYQSPGRMINSYYYIAPVGDWTRDLPHTVASNMVMVSQDLNQSATDGCRVYFYKLIGTYRRTCELVNIICEHMIIDLTNKMWVCTDLANRGQKTDSLAVTVLKSWSKHVMTTHDWISLFSWFAWCCSYQNHSSRGTGRILLQVFFLSQQNLSISPAALGGYCFKFFFFFIPTNVEHSSRGTGRILLQVKFFLYFIPTKFEHSSRGTGRILLQVKFVLYFIPTKCEHSSRSIGRILLQVIFLNSLSQQNIPTKCEHSSRSIDSTSHSKPPRSAYMRLQKLPCTDKGRRRRPMYMTEWNWMTQSQPSQCHLSAYNLPISPAFQ